MFSTVHPSYSQFKLRQKKLQQLDCQYHKQPIVMMSWIRSHSSHNIKKEQKRKNISQLTRQNYDYIKKVKEDKWKRCNLEQRNIRDFQVKTENRDKQAAAEASQSSHRDSYSQRDSKSCSRACCRACCSRTLQQNTWLLMDTLSAAGSDIKRLENREETYMCRAEHYLRQLAGFIMCQLFLFEFISLQMTS